MGADRLQELLPDGSCQHSFVTKPRQSLPPGQDERPTRDSIYKVSALCRYCRIHVQLKVDYTIRWEERPCPNADNPLHHLLSSPWRESVARNDWISKNWNSQAQIYVFECSSPTCSAAVTVQIKPPVLDDQDVRTLIDKDLLKQRTDEAFRTNAGHVEGMKYPTPMDVLVDLRQYLRNAWTRDPRSIAIDNRRFIVRFGPGGNACRDILEKLKFKQEVCLPLRFDQRILTTLGQTLGCSEAKY